MLQKIVLVFALASFAGFAADSENSFSTPAQIGQLKLAPPARKRSIPPSSAQPPMASNAWIRSSWPAPISV